ncbi:hypothetical protein Adt_22645 [Abeliophyllum distichum]|uniref:Uncharacterized protein n=1 Tax=Abeliophyllum distichum TaxID=126358 RepID=A0ABD1S8P3_9LAMI
MQKVLCNSIKSDATSNAVHCDGLSTLPTATTGCNFNPGFSSNSLLTGFTHIFSYQSNFIRILLSPSYTNTIPVNDRSHKPQFSSNHKHYIATLKDGTTVVDGSPMSNTYRSIIHVVTARSL